MALITGTPQGNVDTQETIYLESAPSIFFQDYAADPLWNPDADSLYWGLSGTTSYPAYEIGCPVNVSLTENLTMNDVLCDNVGVEDTVQQRNYIELQFTVQSFFPFQILTHLLKTGTVEETAPFSKIPIGNIDNSQWWMVWCPKVYDESTADFIAIHLHKAKFVDAWTINTPFGSPWQATGIKLRAMADTSKPTAQQFGVFIRLDPSVIT